VASFKDNRGDSWEVLITVATVLDVKSKLGYDLASIADNEDPSADFAKLTKNMGMFVDVLSVVCEEQAIARGLDGRGIAKRWDLNVFKLAVDAFQEAYVDFFLNPQQQKKARALLGQRAAMTEKKLAAEGEKALRKLEELTVSETETESAPESSVSASNSPGS
jgi:hypothetical protein